MYGPSMMRSMEKRYNLGILEALFKDSLIAENCSPNTRKNYLSDIRHFLQWMQWTFSDKFEVQEDGISLFIELFHRHTVDGYLQYLGKKRVPVRSVNRKLSSLRRFSRFCQSRGYLEQNPTDNLSNWVIEEEIDRMSESDMQNSLASSEEGDFMKDYSDSLNDEMKALCYQLYEEIGRTSSQR